jgi:hypothetical protein
LFGRTRAIDWIERNDFEPTEEVEEIYTIYRIEMVDQIDWAFPIHKEFALRFFGSK